MEPVDERGHDAEVAAAAADRPEEVRVLVGARPQQLAVGGDDVGGEQVVAGQAVLAVEPADAATSVRPAMPVDRDCPERSRQTERLRGAVEVGQQQSRLGHRDCALRIDLNSLQRDSRA